jgi:ABC-type polysaccharide/polyol phosphate export permease
VSDQRVGRIAHHYTGSVGAPTNDGPPPELRFRRQLRLVAALRGAWKARELVVTLAERDLRARYKQTVLGVGWAIVTPLTLMVVFSLVFRRVARVDTGEVPYELFTYLGLIPWTFFSAAVSHGGQSLISNAALLNKVYCPREVFPVSAVAVAGVDSAVAIGVLAFLFPLTGFVPRATSYWIPLLLLVQLAFTLGITLTVSAVLVYFRDLRHALPILLQVGLFATPVAYGMDAIPASIRVAYSVVNPLGPVIDGYRRAVLFGAPPDWGLVIAAAVSTSAMLFAGYALFRRLETSFADVA